jgi:hypothetical protein
MAASFCRFCGAPDPGAFCGRCGKAVSEGAPARPASNAPPAKPASYASPPPPPPPSHSAAPAKAGSGNVGKILLFVGGGFLLLVALGVAGVIYVGYRAKQKFEQVKSEYLPASNSGNVRPVAMMKAPTGNGCPVLSWQEASEILGIEWESVKYSPGTDDGGACDFTTTPEERKRFGARQLAAGLSGVSGAKNEQDTQREVQQLFAGAINAVANSQVPAGDKDANAGIRIQFVRKNGGQAWAKFDQMQAGAKVVSGVSGSPIGLTPIEGVGDKAYMLPAGIAVTAIKGDAYFGMNFFAWPGQDKAVALAKRVAGHL